MRFIKGFFTVIGVFVVLLIALAAFGHYLEEQDNKKSIELNSSQREYSNPSKEELKQPKKIECYRCDETGRCDQCGGDGKLICISHDTNGDGYCSECKNIGFIRCFECYGNGRCSKCKGKGYYYR